MDCDGCDRRSHKEGRTGGHERSQVLTCAAGRGGAACTGSCIEDIVIAGVWMVVGPGRELVSVSDVGVDTSIDPIAAA